VGVLDHHHLWPAPPVELVQEPGEQLLARASGGQEGGQPAAGLAPQVVQRPKRPGREQRVAGPEQEPGVGRMALGEPPDQRRLAHAGLAGHQDDTAAGGRRAQGGAQLIQQRSALEQVHLLRDGTPADGPNLSAGSVEATLVTESRARQPAPREWAMEILRSDQAGCLVVGFTGSIDLFSVTQIRTTLLRTSATSPISVRSCAATGCTSPCGTTTQGCCAWSFPTRRR
jgi:hypothetical protein